MTPALQCRYLSHLQYKWQSTRVDHAYSSLSTRYFLPELGGISVSVATSPMMALTALTSSLGRMPSLNFLTKSLDLIFPLRRMSSMTESRVTSRSFLGCQCGNHCELVGRNAALQGIGSDALPSWTPSRRRRCRLLAFAFGQWQSRIHWGCRREEHSVPERLGESAVQGEQARPRCV